MPRYQVKGRVRQTVFNAKGAASRVIVRDRVLGEVDGADADEARREAEHRWPAIREFMLAPVNASAVAR